MNDISVLSFVYQEAENIDAWLGHLKPHVKEIIIFDLESTDNTFELCKKYTDKVYKVPYLLCGDSYKIELHSRAKGSWLLWTYPDERFSESFLNVLPKLTSNDKWNAYSIMRHEYLDGIRACYKDGERIIAFGTPENPNYQCRLHKNDGRIFYTELVHFEIAGTYNNCPLPPEYNMAHLKSSSSQEFDNIRLYLLYKELIWKYGNTTTQPYKQYIDSYKKIVHDSEAKNLSGERKIHLSEEFWHVWKMYAHTQRITLDEFKAYIGLSYEEFLHKNKYDQNAQFIIPDSIVDPILQNK